MIGGGVMASRITVMVSPKGYVGPFVRVEHSCGHSARTMFSGESIAHAFMGRLDLVVTYCPMCAAKGL